MLYLSYIIYIHSAVWQNKHLALYKIPKDLVINYSLLLISMGRIIARVPWEVQWMSVLSMIDTYSKQ